MNGADAIRQTIGHAHQWFTGTVVDLTQEQADYLPSGAAYPIGELVAHVLQSEDMIVNGMVRGQASVWQSGGWEQTLGIPDVSRHTQEVARGFKTSIADLKPYQEAVYASVDEYLGGLTEGELAREVPGPAGPMTVYDVLSNFLVGNTLAHTGEISALKGLQGAKGYPF